MDMMARLAATYDKGRPGPAWRNILDTTNDPTIAKRAPLPFRNYQMSEDSHSGGQPIWIAVDAKLRELSGDRHSLDDFARAFFASTPAPGTLTPSNSTTSSRPWPAPRPTSGPVS